MPSSTSRFPRRRILAAAATSLAAAASLGPWFPSPAEAARVDPDGATAIALGYRPDGAETERPHDDPHCGSCMHFAGTAGWAPCAIFQGRLVNAGGWCRAYTKR